MENVGENRVLFWQDSYQSNLDQFGKIPYFTYEILIETCAY